VVSKLQERLVAQQLKSYLKTADLLALQQQSAYRPFRFTETVVLHVLAAILNVADHDDVSAPVTLDLSAAIVTFDDDVLLRRLMLSYGVMGNTHSWFQSYLKGRTQHVCLGSTIGYPSFDSLAAEITVDVKLITWSHTVCSVYG
jgi:hypothetical protein